MTESTGLRQMTPADLSDVFEWRNHPDIRRFMLTKHEISLEEHCAWFERTAGEPRRELLIYERAGQPLGFVQFSNIGIGEVSDWGFYTAPNAPKGTGRSMAVAALMRAFGKIGLHKVCGQALAFNQASIKFHSALGFKREGRLREQHFDGMNHYDVICFGLLNREWDITAPEGKP